MFHYHLEWLMRTMRYDLMEKTGVNVNVKSLLALWLVRHCAWSLTRFAVDADVQTAFKGEMSCHAFVGPSVTESRFEPKPKWHRDGKRMACSWESWTCLMRCSLVPAKALRRHGHSDECGQIHNGVQRLCGCLSGYRGTRGAS